MTFQKWAWNIFETTGNPEAFLAMKEAEAQEKKKAFGKMEVGNLEAGEILFRNKELESKQKNGDFNGANKNEGNCNRGSKFGGQ